MPAHLRTAYPTFETLLRRIERDIDITPSIDEIGWARQSVKGERQLLSFLVLFKCAEHLEFVPTLMTVPEVIVEHIHAHLRNTRNISLNDIKIRPLSRAALYGPTGYHAAIRTRLGLGEFTREAQTRLEASLTGATQTQHSTSDLVNAAVEWLVHEKVEIPALNTLRRICGRVNSDNHRAIEKKVMARITDETRAMLDALLRSAPGQLLATWMRIRERPGAPTLHALRDYLDFAEWIWGLGPLSSLVVDVPRPKLRYYSAEARELAASDLINFGATDHRYVIMIAAIVEAQQHARDALAQFFCKRMAQFEKEAQGDVDEAHLRQRSLVERVVTVFREVLVALEEKRPIKLVKAIWAIILLAGSRESLITDCDHILGTVSLKDRLETFMWRHFKSNRIALFQLVRCLPLRATTGDPSLLEAIQAVLRDESADGNYRPRDFDLTWASESWRKRVLTLHEGKPVYRRDALELCVFTHLAQELRSGDIAVIGSAEHADYRDQLLAWPETAENLGGYAAATGISIEPAPFVADLKHRLETAIANARHKLNAKPLGKRKDGDWTLKRYPKPLPNPQFAALETTVQRQLDDRGLIEILVNADGLTRFTQHFGPPGVALVTGGKFQIRAVRCQRDAIKSETFLQTWPCARQAHGQPDP
jgi:hypothetical protein